MEECPFCLWVGKVCPGGGENVTILAPNLLIRYLIY